MEETSAEDLQAVMGVTGADAATAQRYLAKAAGKADVAAALFFQELDGPAEGAAGAALGADDDDMASEASDVVEDEEDGAPPPGSVDAILGKAKEGSKRDEKVQAEKKWAGGNRLGSTAEGAEAAEAAEPQLQQEAGEASGSGGSRPARVKTVHIWFFSDGFTVDEATEDAEPKEEAPVAKPVRRTGMATLNDFEKPAGGKGKLAKMPKLPALRPYETPESQAFLAAIKGGFVPKELRKVDDATKDPIGVSIAVTDFRPEAYPQKLADMQKELEEKKGKGPGDAGPAAGSSSSPPGPSLFSGAGQTLAGAGSSPAGAGADATLLELAAAAAPAVDESKPATTIQLRLASGKRVQVKLNLDSTVADLWRVVAAEMGQAAFAAASQHALSAGFPPKPLTDMKATIKDADLANSSVTHRCA